MTDAPGTTSGMIGLGNMGGRIARRIRDAGRPVLGYDLDAGQAAAAGVPVMSSIAELSAAAEIVFLSLPDSAAVEAVVLGERGLLENARAGQVVVDLSTAAPASTQKICAALAERDVAFVDAGISGGAAAAERGRSRSWRAARARPSRERRRSSRRSARASRTWGRPVRAMSRSC